MLDDKITEIFVQIDDFCIEFDQQIKCFRVKGNKNGSRMRPGLMSDSEIMTILICFHQSHFTNFKAFFKGKTLHAVANQSAKAPSGATMVTFR